SAPTTSATARCCGRSISARRSTAILRAFPSTAGSTSPSARVPPDSRSGSRGSPPRRVPAQETSCTSSPCPTERRYAAVTSAAPFNYHAGGTPRSVNEGSMRHRLSWVMQSAALAVVALAVTSFGASAQPSRPERIAEHPNLNGIWQAANTAYWNLEAHSAEALEKFWELGALGAIPAGQSVVVGGTIPYKPEKLAQREENRANWPKADPVASCYMPGIPRAT